MIEKYGGLIEAAITAVVVLGFCAYQYWATDRSIKADKRASAGDAGHPEGEHELGDGRNKTVH